MSAPPLTCELQGTGSLTSGGPCTVWHKGQSSLSAALKFSNFYSRRERGVRTFRSCFLQSHGVTLPQGDFSGFQLASICWAFSTVPLVSPVLTFHRMVIVHFFTFSKEFPRENSPYETHKRARLCKWRKTHPWVPVLFPQHRTVQTSGAQARAEFPM